MGDATVDVEVPEDVSVQRVTYRTVAGVSLRMLVYRPQASAGPARPAILWFHGGGWVKGNPEAFAPFCIAAVRAGMMALAPQYRLVGGAAQSAWDCMADAWAARCWVAEQAADLGVDPQRVVAAGSSAGGHLAASLATHRQAANLGDGDGDGNLAAMVLLNPVLDCTQRGYPMPDRGHEASPVHHIRPGLPPTLIIHGDADTVVPHENSVRFHQGMVEAGNACRLITEPGEEHGLWARHRERMIAASYGFLSELGLAAGAEQPTP